jgi:hypothetical protein
MRQLAKFGYKSVRRAPLLWQLRGLVSWDPLGEPEPGYTIVIAGMRRLWPVAIANLRLIAECDRMHLREVVLVMDDSIEQLPREFLAGTTEMESAGLPLRIIGYDDAQRRTAHRINWGWVYSWLSWSKGIAAARTGRVILHDLDAMPIDPGLFRRLFEAAEQAEAQFQGVRFYSGNGVTPEMGLVTTFEMVIDIAWLRRAARPIEGFNQIRLVDGHYVDFDTWLEVQRRAPRRRVEEVAADSLVHPSQLICQFTEHMAGRDDRLARGHQLPILQYFYYLGDTSTPLDAVGDRIADPLADSAPFFGKPAKLTSIHPASWAWMEKQIRRLEQHLHGTTRPEVHHYLRGFVQRAGDERTVGREPLDAGGVPDR